MTIDNRNKCSRRAGFTLIEVLLSSLLLGVGALIIGGLARRSMYNNIRGWEYEQAYRLLDECLDGVVGRGLEQVGYEGTVDGDFGARYPRYYYRLLIEPTEQADLYRVRARVFWKVRGSTSQVEAVTMIYDLSGKASVAVKK